MFQAQTHMRVSNENKVRLRTWDLTLNICMPIKIEIQGVYYVINV